MTTAAWSFNISDSARDPIRELAREILNAQNDEEFLEACRAMMDRLEREGVDSTG